MFANANIDPKKTPPFPVDAFNPFREAKKQIEKLTKKESVELVATMWGARRDG